MARIRALRRELRLSQAQFASLLGVHQTAVSQWETGRTTPDLDTLHLIARVTGKSMDYIMEWDKGEHAETARNAARDTLCEHGERGEREFALSMGDDGMLGARIRRGDDVFLHVCEDVPDGAIAAVELGENVRIRYLYHMPNSLLLVPASPDYPTETLPENARVLGRAVGFRSAL